MPGGTLDWPNDTTGRDTVDGLAKLIAKSEIQDCLNRYARSVDRRDWDMLRGCFHRDSMDHHGEFHGNGEQFIDWVSARHKDVPFSMHYLMNCTVDFESDTVAGVETYFWAIQRRDRTSPDGSVSGTDHEVFGRYIDRFERRDTVWRIADRKVAYDSTRQTSSTHHLRKMVGVLGRRDRRDPVFGPLAAE